MKRLDPAAARRLNKTMASVSHLLLAMAFIELGSSLQGLLIPIRAQLEGFSTPAIGLLGASYYFGFALGCVFVPAIVRRVGHIRVFSGFAALAAAALLAHALVPAFLPWLVLRGLTGFCFAALFMAVESWLNDRATDENRGRVLAAYMTNTWVAVVLGKVLFALWLDPADYIAFALVSITICLAVVPVAFTRQSAPPVAPAARLSPARLMAMSPVGAFGCFLAGAAAGAFWSLAPIYAAPQGLATTEAALFMTASVLGGAVGQLPLGRFSDVTDRRMVIAVACIAAAGAALLLVLRADAGRAALLAYGACFGAFALPLYALCVAHANDRAPADAFVDVSSVLLMVFGIGAVIGPVAAGLLMAEVGHVGVFMFTAAAHVTLGAFTVVRILFDERAPATDKAAFVSSPRTVTQAAAPLDPRAQPPQPELPGTDDWLRPSSASAR